MIIIQNYHKHSDYSNIYAVDSITTYEDYAKRSIELGHKVLSSVEHGYQSNYHVPYKVAKKYGLNFVIGAEAYFVNDRFEKDRSNYHIIILCKSEKGRRALNNILSEANISGYYYRPRIDMELLFSLPPDDVLITTACVSMWANPDVDNLIIQLQQKFGGNFYLEIQAHHTQKQISVNEKILSISSKHGIEMIVGLDSHYIHESDAELRNEALLSKGIRYEDEDGWMMGYPDDETAMQRFIDQGVFTQEQIQKAMDATDKILEFDDYSINNPVFSTVPKLPSLYKTKTQDEKNKIYSKLITRLFKQYMKNIPESEYERYYEGVRNEVQVYKNTGMVDYPLINYEIIKRGVEKGGVITQTGRGSAVSFITNSLCGFSNIDRFTSDIKLYPERFMSESRILQTNSLPDIDFNVGTPEIFEEAQREIMGDDHVAMMVAFGTFKKKSAFKLYAKAQNLDFEIANEISGQIEKYETALKYADDDDKDTIDIYDYVDEKYRDYIEQSESYWGIVADKKKAPSAFLLYEGSIREEIGLLKCKSETTKKEYMTTVIDGGVAEDFKFLKNDILTVTVVLLIDRIYKRIGKEIPTVNELLNLIKGNQKVWDIYAKGLTIGVNQVEKKATTNKAMKYKPQNIAELSTFIAAIRPGFKSMYPTFESRDDFSYGIPTFDNLLITPEIPKPYMVFQEQIMITLNYAGFPMDECYGIIKAISKKHPEIVSPLKERFVSNFTKQIMIDEDIDIQKAEEMSLKVWQVIDDNANYSFNAAHAYSMGIDSAYCAYLKSHYPYEFYEVLLQVYSDKSKKDKVADLKQEMLRGFGIKEGKYKWGADNRKFVADKENHVIYPSLLSLKGLSQKCADDLYKLSGKKKFNVFYSLLKEIKKIKSLNSGKIKTLVQIGYFDEFATIGKIEKFITAYDDLFERSQFSFENINKDYAKYIEKYSTKSEKQYRNFDYENALIEIWEDLEDNDVPINERIKYELLNLGYVKTILPEFTPEYAFVQEYECKFKNPKITLYRLCNGDIEVVKVKRNQYDQAPIKVGDIIKTIECSNEGRWSKDSNGDWQQSRTDKEVILKKWHFVR